MPTDFLQRRLPKLNRWHVAGLVIGYAVATIVVFWMATEGGKRAAPVTTGIAPASQSGKPLPTE